MKPDLCPRCGLPPDQCALLTEAERIIGHHELIAAVDRMRGRLPPSADPELT